MKEVNRVQDDSRHVIHYTLDEKKEGTSADLESLVM